MTAIFDENFGNHLWAFGDEPSDDPTQPRRASFRLPVLLNLVLGANLRLRTCTSIDRIKVAVGADSLGDVTSALIWLFEQGALYAVPPMLRMGAEEAITEQEYVFQLTGVIQFYGQWEAYLAFNPDELEDTIEEWTEVRREIPVASDFFTAYPRYLGG